MASLEEHTLKNQQFLTPLEITAATGTYFQRARIKQQ